jgi:hypothetical protein
MKQYKIKFLVLDNGASLHFATLSESGRFEQDPIAPRLFRTKLEARNYIKYSPHCRLYESELVIEGKRGGLYNGVTGAWL